MGAVPTAPAPPRNTWICPTCRHGSPDPRDELAHLDAHHQLGRFLEEWDAAVVSDRKKERSRRPAGLVLGALVAVAAMVTAVVFWGIHHGGAPSPRVAGPVPVVPVVPAPEVTGQVPTPSPPPDTTQLTPPAPQPAVPPSPSVTAPVVGTADPTPIAEAVPGDAMPADDGGATASEASPPPVLSAAASPEPLRAGAPTPPRAYLLQACVVAICLTIP